MDPEMLKDLLSEVRDGRVDIGEAARRIGGFVPGAAADPQAEAVWRVDHHRGVRCGFPEVVYGQGKTPDDLVRIAREILDRSDTLLVTRVDAERAGRLLEAFDDAEHHERARCILVRRGERAAGRKGIAIVAAGTADVPVAEEARITATAMGEDPLALYDVGVAGLHRLLAHTEALREARVVVVAAGMEGALPSVVGGLVAVPVIAVPTSVGYGISLGGLAALMGMMNSCASNVTVVNIDNGFGAGYVASLINNVR